MSTPPMPAAHTQAALATHLRATLSDIRSGYDNLETPYRGEVGVRTFERGPGPRAPLSASVIDQRITAKRTLTAIVTDYLPYTGGPAPTSAEVEDCLTWLSRHAETLVGVLHPSDMLDLEILREQLVRASGIHTKDEDHSVALAETRRKMMPGASHYGPAREIARLAAAAGRPVNRSTVARWAMAGHVDTRDMGTETHYSLDDVLIYHDIQNAPEDEEGPQYGEGFRGSSRKVADLATEAGWPVSYDTVQRWATDGLVTRTEEGYSYDDVMDRLIGDPEEVEPPA